MTTPQLPSDGPRRIACPRCGAAFECRLTGGCWCADEPYKLPITAAIAEDCLCPACLRNEAAKLQDNAR